MSTYFSPEGGLPPQTQLLTDRAVVKEAYTVIPKGVLRDIVTSNLPGWTGTRAWILARPIAGFATTFSQLIVEVAPAGGSQKPEAEAGVEGVIFLTNGELTLTLDGETHHLEAGSYAYSQPARTGRSPTTPEPGRRVSSGSARPTSRWRDTRRNRS